MILNRFTISLIAGAALLLGAEAQGVDFTIDSSQSNLSIISTSAFGVLPGTTAPNGDSTTLSGTIRAAVTGNTFQILDGSSFLADDEDSFLPAAARRQR